MNSELFGKVFLKPAAVAPREREREERKGIPVKNLGFPNAKEITKKFGPTIEQDEMMQLAEYQNNYYDKNPDKRQSIGKAPVKERPVDPEPRPTQDAPTPVTDAAPTPWQAWQDQTDEESIAAQQNELLAKSRAQSQFIDLNRDQSDVYNQDSTSTHHNPVIWGPDQELVDGEWFDQAPKEFWPVDPSTGQPVAMPSSAERNRINADPEAMGTFWGRNYYWPWHDKASWHPDDWLVGDWAFGQDEEDPRAYVNHTYNGGSYWSNRDKVDPRHTNATEKLNKLLNYTPPAHDSLVKDRQLHNDHATFKKWLSNSLPEDYQADYLIP